MSDIVIREFEPADAAAFRALNEEWIERHFRLEPKDRETLNHPRQAILDKGGRILMAVRDGVGVGCCALIAIAEREFELAKMAVTPTERRTGIGRRLIAAAAELAEELGATRLYLETNHTLHAAIALYEAMGFRHLPPKRITPSPYARADVYMEWLVGAAAANDEPVSAA